MARNFIGWVSEHRSIMTTWVWKDDKAYRLYRALVMLANWEDGTELLKKQKVAVKRGQIATSTRDLAAITGLDQKTVLRKLALLERDSQNGKFLTQEVTRNGTIITICNYDEDQHHKKERDSQLDSDHDSQNVPIRTNEQVNKNSPLKPPHGGAPVKSNLRSLRRKPAQCPCGGSGEVPTRRQGVDGDWEQGIAACPTCRSKLGGIWSLEDAARYGWELSKSQN